jgi:hypothetical protein
VATQSELGKEGVEDWATAGSLVRFCYDTMLPNIPQVTKPPHTSRPITQICYPWCPQPHLSQSTPCFCVCVSAFPGCDCGNHRCTTPEYASQTTLPDSKIVIFHLSGEGKHRAQFRFKLGLWTPWDPYNYAKSSTDARIIH